MGRRSEQRRAERREKQARRWARNDNALARTSREGIAKGSENSVECCRSRGAGLGRKAPRD